MVAQGSQLPAKYAACVYVDRIVHPLRFGYGCMPIYYHCRATIVSGPIAANGQAKLVHFARRIAIEGKSLNLVVASPYHILFDARVRDHEPALVQHIVAYQPMQEITRLVNELGWL